MILEPDVEKKCFKCGTAKPIGDFYKLAHMRDGHLNKCKQCTIADVKQYRRNPVYRSRVLAYDRERGSRRTADYLRAYRSENPDAAKAHQAINYAIRTGKMRRPSKCEACGAECVPHGHHHDYSKPLAVVWLCVACHRQHHSMMDLIERVMSASEKSA